MTDSCERTVCDIPSVGGSGSSPTAVKSSDGEALEKDPWVCRRDKRLETAGCTVSKSSVFAGLCKKAIRAGESDS